MALPVVAVVGRPNVGKSTLFNKIVGQRISIVEDTPGVTRDRIYSKCEWRGRDFMVVDTGGIEPNSEDIILRQMRRQAELAIEKEETILNPSYLLDELNYKPTNYSKYDFELAMSTARGCIEKYLKVLADLRNKTNDPSVQSLLDDIARYWKKEKDYKIKARLADLE